MPRWSHSSTAEVVIPTGTSVSAAVSTEGFTNGLLIASPAALTGTITIQVPGPGSTWVPLQSNGANITIAASVAIQVLEVLFEQFRLASSGVEAADRTFLVKQGIPAA